MIVFSTEWTVFDKVEAYRQNSKLKKKHIITLMMVGTQRSTFMKLNVESAYLENLRATRKQEPRDIGLGAKWT